MNKSRFPDGWDEARVRRVLMHYESQTDDQAVEEDESALSDPKRSVVEVPSELMPVIREVIGQHERSKRKPGARQSARKGPSRRRS